MANSKVHAQGYCMPRYAGLDPLDAEDAAAQPPVPLKINTLTLFLSLVLYHQGPPQAHDDSLSAVSSC